MLINSLPPLKRITVSSLPSPKPVGAVPTEPQLRGSSVMAPRLPARGADTLPRRLCRLTLPQYRTDLATVATARPVDTTIIINSQAVSDVSVRLGTWTYQPVALFAFPGMHELLVERTIEENEMALHLPPLEMPGTPSWLSLSYLQEPMRLVMSITCGVLTLHNGHHLPRCSRRATKESAPARRFTTPGAPCDP
jgi:hypothetical protein